MGLIIFLAVPVILLVILFLLNFYRDPKRIIPKGYNIVAPADGRVISIIDTAKASTTIKKGLMGKIRLLTRDVAEQCHAISIFMSPLDVHINRSPISGVVKSVKHSKGKFFVAFNLEKSLLNEKNEIIIESKELKVKVIQIAGFLARKIKCYVKKNQKLNKGDRIGMIALGSQTTLVLPKGVVLKVKVHDYVKAGSTVIAEQ